MEGQGLHRINHGIVVQRFGQWRNGNFISAHNHLLYFARDRDNRTWNPDDILVQSDRATKYADPRTQKTSQPGLRVPLDVWGADEPHFGRVQGNNRERMPGHPNQIPEAVLARVLRATTNPGDLVLDPFLGSGTTATVARALGRESIGIEINKKFAASAFKRIKRGAVRVERDVGK